jgi:hypothetical protein
MNLISIIPIKTKTGLLITFVVLLIIGYLLFTWLQPQCEPCPVNVKCQPCISKAQQVVLYVGAFLGLLLIAKGIIISPDNKEGK